MNFYITNTSKFSQTICFRNLKQLSQTYTVYLPTFLKYLLQYKQVSLAFCKVKTCQLYKQNVSLEGAF